MNAVHYFLSFVVAIAILVTVHELGHYLAARLCGVKILRFSLGFGRIVKVWRLGVDQTEWALSVIPLGGYVKMLDEREGEVPVAERTRSFNVQPLYKRSFIVLAGPLSNLLLASCIYWVGACLGTRELPPVIGQVTAGSALQRAGVAAGDRITEVGGQGVRSWSEFKWQVVDQAVGGGRLLLALDRGGVPVSNVDVDVSSVVLDEHAPDPLQQLGAVPRLPILPAVVGRVVEGRPAMRAGLMTGDQITKIDDRSIEDWGAFVELISASAGKALKLSVLRQGSLQEIVVTPELVPGGPNRGQIGVQVKPDEEGFKRATIEVRYGLLDGLRRGFVQTWETSVFSLKVMWRIVTGHISFRNVSGPLTIADYAGQSASAGFGAYFRFLALISVSIGVLNLLPIPILDGGHLLYHAAEFIRGKPLPERVEEYGQRVGMILLAGLMALAFFNDFNRFFFG